MEVEYPQRRVTVSEPGVSVRLKGALPASQARTLQRVLLLLPPALGVEDLAQRCGEVRGASGVDLRTGHRAPAGEHLGLHLAPPVVKVLLQLTGGGADLHRCQPGQGSLDLIAQIGRLVQHPGGGDDVREQLAHHLRRGSRPHGQGAGAAVGVDPDVLEVDVRCSHQPAVGRFLDEHVEVERGGVPDGRPEAAQLGEIAREGVVLPQVLGQPRVAGHEVRPLRVVPDRLGVAPDVGAVVRHPAAGAVVVPRHSGPVLAELPGQLQQRLVALGQVRCLDRPVVDLGVAVDRPVRPPRGVDRGVPDALQVGGLAARPGGGDQEVTAELVVQRGQARIGAAVGHVRTEAFVGGKRLSLR